MPKHSINYQNTIIYKICCNDLDIHYTYVGHTTDFIKRKYHHKYTCNNKNNNNSNAYNVKVYQTIRENGGWENRSMIKLENYSCDDSQESKKRERYWYDKLNADLNMITPYLSDKE